jgi:hypothetical protein
MSKRITFLVTQAHLGPYPLICSDSELNYKTDKRFRYLGPFLAKLTNLSQGLYLHIKKQIQACIHAPSGIRIRDPSVRTMQYRTYISVTTVMRRSRAAEAPLNPLLTNHCTNVLTRIHECYKLLKILIMPEI